MFLYLYPPTPISVTIPPGAATAANQDYAPVGIAMLDFSLTNVTDAAYVQLLASAPASRKIQIFMSSGEPLYLAFGAAASEVDKFFIMPGGNGLVDLVIPAATRLSLKAVNAGTTVNSGVILANLLG